MAGFDLPQPKKPSFLSEMGIDPTSEKGRMWAEHLRAATATWEGYESDPPEEPPSTTLPFGIDTVEERKVAQQVFGDIANFWLGRPVEYLALYQRDW